MGLGNKAHGDKSLWQTNDKEKTHRLTVFYVIVKNTEVVTAKQLSFPAAICGDPFCDCIGVRGLEHSFIKRARDSFFFSPNLLIRSSRNYQLWIQEMFKKVQLDRSTVDAFLPLGSRLFKVAISVTFLEKEKSSSLSSMNTQFSFQGFLSSSVRLLLGLAISSKNSNILVPQCSRNRRVGSEQSRCVGVKVLLAYEEERLLELGSRHVEVMRKEDRVVVFVGDEEVVSVNWRRPVHREVTERKSVLHNQAHDYQQQHRLERKSPA